MKSYCHFLFILLTLSLFTLSSTTFSAFNPQNLKEKPKVIYRELRPQADEKSILIPAIIKAQRQTIVTAESEGHVTQIYKNLGAKVHSADVILTIENKDPNFTYAKVPVKSPLKGIVGQIFVTEFTKVSRGDKLFTIIDPHSLKIEGELTSEGMSFVTPGMEGEFIFSSSPISKNNDSYKVRVKALSPLLDARTGTAPFEMEFVTKNRESLPSIGIIGQVKFTMTKGQIFLIPENALLYNEGKPQVRILRHDSLTEKRPIELGEQREDLFVVKGGLKLGEKIVLRSSRTIQNGEKVEAESEEKSK